MPKPIRYTFLPCQREDHASCAGEHPDGRFASQCDCACHAIIGEPPPKPEDLPDLKPITSLVQ